MTKSLLKFILTALFLLTQLLSFSQSDGWVEISSSRVLAEGEPMISARAAKYYELGFASLHQRLINGTSDESLSIDLPLPDGKITSFRLKSNTAMQPGLQAKFPSIRTFDALSTDGRLIQAKIDVSPAGLHAAVALDGGTVYIDPIYLNQDEMYIVYRRADFTTEKIFECLFDESPKTTTEPKSGSSYGECELNIYRLAMAATGEYTQFHGGTVELGMAAIVTTVNRLNQIYERDLGVTLSLVENNDEIVYTNPSSDPYTNNSPFAMLNQNQSNINSVIGSANYDVGHVVSTGGGGVAGLGVTCQNGQKARGVTGTPTPIGDPFDIDYVAHEMGHQFGANHTFNNSCQGNRSNFTAVEPGSGATIMSYAGICAPNIQNHSDAYFHGMSLYEIGANVSSNNCQVIVSTGNTAPVIDSVTTNVYLPISTPFALTGYSYDEDPDDVPIYSWEQMDVEISQQPPTSNATGGPNFRSFDPTDSPTRYFPRLSTLASSGTSTWEVLPSVSRDMSFRFTVRDNTPGAGCTQYEDGTLHFDESAGPFVVTYPSAANIEWDSFDTETVTWDIAGTDASPINAQWVDIFLSIDGGQSYPITLAETVANTGGASVEVPNISTTQARVMVMSSSGTFFDISDKNFSIHGIDNGFVVLSANPDSSTCIGDDLVLDVHIVAIGAFDDPVSLSVVNPPIEYDVALGATELFPGESTTLTISNTGGVLPGMVELAILGQADDMQHTRLFNIGFNEANLLTPTNLIPFDGEENVPTNPLLNWAPSASPDAVYHIQLSQDEDLIALLIDADIASSTFQMWGLEPETTYYWRVALSNPCDTTGFSAIHSFSTLSCYSFIPDDLPQAIPPIITTITSVVDIPFSGIVSDVKVLGLNGTHARISDLTFSLVSPAGTEIELMANVCGNGQDFNISFDDAAVFSSPDCPPTSGQTVKPNEPLSVFAGQDTQGLWQLKIFDSQFGGGGQFIGWTLEICTAQGGTFMLQPEGDLVTACQGDERLVDIEILDVFGFDGPVELSASGLPDGVVADFDPPTVTTGDLSVMTLTIGPSVSPGQYEFIVVGTTESEVVEYPMTLLVNESTPEPVTLISPTDGESEVPVSETFH